MRQMKWIALLLALLLALTGCGGAVEGGEAASSAGDGDSAQSAGTETEDGQADTVSDTADTDSADSTEDANEGIAYLPLGMYLTVQKVEDGIATVLIDNQSGYTMSYGEAYSLEQEQDGQWQELPAQEELSFHDLAHELQDLEQATITCDLTYWGELAPGHYRLVLGDLTGEFTLTSPNNTAGEDG